MNRVSNHIITFAALVAIIFGFAVEANAQRNNQRVVQRNVQRGEVAVTPPANHMTFGGARQATRQVKVETVTVEITPKDRMDYHNAAGAFHGAVAQLKQRYHGSRDFNSFEQAVRRELVTHAKPLGERIGVDKFDALQAEYRFSVTTFETIINTALDWGQRNINRNPRGFNGAGIITDMSPHEEAEFAQEFARSIQNHRTTDRVTFVRESGGPRGIYELISVGNTPIQQAQQQAPARPALNNVQQSHTAPTTQKTHICPITGVNFFAPYYTTTGGARQGLPTLAERHMVGGVRPQGREGPLVMPDDYYKHFDYYNSKSTQKTDDGSNLAP